jgi:hypothetical protein
MADARIRFIIEGVNRLTGPLRAAGGALKGIGAIAAGVTGVVGAAGFAVFKFADEFQEAASKINDFSEQTGIARGLLQEYAYGAELAGVAQETLFKSLQVFNKNLGLAGKGGGPALKVLDGLRIKFRDARGQAKPLVDVLPLIAERLKQIKNPATQAAAASALFGRGGAQLLPILRDGSAGVAEFTKAARELGVVMSDEMVVAGDDLGDAMGDVGKAFRATRFALVGTFAPALTEVAKSVTEFFVTNRPVIVEWAKEFSKNLPEKIQVFIKSAKELIPSIERIGEALVSLAETGEKLGRFLQPFIDDTDELNQSGQSVLKTFRNILTLPTSGFRNAAGAYLTAPTVAGVAQRYNAAPANVASAGSVVDSRQDISINFGGLPKGATVETKSTGPAKVEVNRGYLYP